MDNTELVEEETDPGRWLMLFDARQQAEINFNVIYARQFKHGTNGHNERLVMARLYDLVNLLATEVPGVTGKIEELLANGRL